MAYYVYNPDDEWDVAQYNKVEYRLQPNEMTKFESREAAEHVANSLRMWGVRLIDGKTPAEISAQIDEAEATYLKATYEWARNLAHAFVERSEKDAKGGLPLTVRTVDEIKALDWVDRNKARLSAAGLI